MRLILSVLSITFFILVAQGQSFVSEFLRDFKHENTLNLTVSHDDIVCIENGAQIINSSLQLLFNYRNQTSEGLLLNFLSLYQQTEMNFNQCQKTFSELASNISRLLQNQERIQNNLNNYYPLIIQNLGAYIQNSKLGNGLQSASILKAIVYHIFGEVGSGPVRKFYNPKKVVEFDPKRFYEEFIPNFLNRLFHSLINQTITKGVGKCMSKNAYIIHNSIREEKVFEALMNVPYWLEEIESCVYFENINVTFLKNFLEFAINHWKEYAKKDFEEFLLKFAKFHKLFLSGMEKVHEGEYLEAGTLFAKLVRTAFDFTFISHLNSLWKI